MSHASGIKSAILERIARASSRCLLGMGACVTGLHMLLLRWCMMALRSYVYPSAAMTGSRISFLVSGQVSPYCSARC